ncbi:MAG: hypothetical protein M3279_06460 [Actinomycetota bacterium]|nr:hypothetical protein [Actinomycetota bacterium]
MRRQNAVAAATALALLVPGSPSSLASAPPAPALQLVVRAPHQAYVDGTQRAGFRLAGACIPASDDLTARAGGCSPSNGVSGSVRSAVLGFDARRRSETVPADVPFVQTPQVGALDQLQVVEVAVRRRADLTIVMKARGGPRPVPDTLSAGGRIENGAAVWRLGLLGPGTYAVSARFTPGADSGGRFMPETTVTLAGDAPWRTPFGPVEGAPGIVRRTSTLVFEQHLSPLTGPPDVRAGAYQGHGPRPLAWSAESWALARGAYDAEASGRRAVTAKLLVADRYPGARRINSASMTYASLTSSGGPKFLPAGGFLRDASSRFRGFRTTVATAASSPQEPAGGRIWDGDYGRYGFTMNAGSVHTARQRPPRHAAGTLAARWGGSTAESWTQVETTPVPLAEPAPPGSPGLAPMGTVHQREAAIPVMATGGDVDNRSGQETLWGHPIRVPVPEASASQTVLSSWTAPPKSRYVAEVETSGRHVTITPGIEPGGYLLRGRMRGYSWDWVVHQDVSVVTPFASRARGLRVGRTIIAPRGAATCVAVLSATHDVTRCVRPGLWTMVATEAGVDFDRVATARR